MNFKEFLQNNIVILDGGMGTLLQANGMKSGDSPEEWNLSHADVVTKIHKDYYEAGSNVVAANTFGANIFHYSKDELEKYIPAAIANARKAAETADETIPTASKKAERYIGLDIGSLGQLLKPYGTLDFEDAVDAFKVTMEIGVKAGADFIYIETMNDCYETKAAVLAAKETCNLPIVVSNAYGEDGKLMTGASPSAMVAMLEGMGVTALGCNCSLGPKQLEPVIDELIETCSIPVMFKPNAGLPKVVDGKTCFDVTVDEFATEVTEAVKKGVRLIGGCCGTTPEYIRKLSACVKGMKPVALTDKGISCVSSYTHAVRFAKAPILIGERLNPTGKKKLKAALVDHDMTYILEEGLKQVECGAHILDVNVGTPDVDEKSLLPEVVCELQAVTNVPLQIDTSDPVAMEAALRRYNGKALINSVNGKEEVMDAIFPLARKYGGYIVCLTLDEDGIPETASKRIEIAQRIIDKAAEYGIARKDLIFDTLAMTISADTKAAVATLDSLSYIRNELGIHTSLGASNISFGLPERDLINGTFFAVALSRGLSAAIMNPYSTEMMKTYYAYRALHDMDENCLEYIDYALRAKEENEAKEAAIAQAALSKAGASQAGNISDNAGSVANVSGSAENIADVSDNAGSVSNVSGSAGNIANVSGNAGGTEKSALYKSIVKGLKKNAADCTTEMIKAGKAPIDIVNENVIPALDEVGSLFEAKKFFLPQLLMAAEAAGEAFEVVKDEMKRNPAAQSAKKYSIVIATVKGDVHDIGKNIVKLLLENYGYDVVDLGRDVDSEVILTEVEKLHAPVCGLSALMTTTVPAMEDTIKLIHEKAPWCKVVVGGAVLTQEYADKIGADAYSKDAMATVRFAESI